MCFNPLIFPSESTLCYGYRGYRRSPTKKALLIAICYKDNAGVDGFDSLTTPHADAESFKQLLLDQYGYRERNVTVMSDAPESPKTLMPTHENILREITRLVEGAQAGDRFVFYFSGHCDQIESKSRSEDDGKDEVILPVDHKGLECEEKLITDNKLRALMVDSLPPDTWLTAIFDSCHSGTLLDLNHYNCNSIYYPWISKGPRGNRSLWQCVDRKDALYSSPTGTRIVQTRKTSDHVIQRRESSIAIHPTEAGLPPRVSVRSRSSSIPLQSDNASFIVEEIGQRGDVDVPSTVTEENSSGIKSLEIPRCQSPTQMSKCSGSDCVDSPTEKPSVLSFSACEDWQMVWDVPGDYTMTKALIETLTEDPQPLLDDLVKRVAYRLHKCAMQLHKATGDYRSKLKMARRARQLEAQSRAESYPSGLTQTSIGDEVNFWTPQVGSLKCVKMSEDHFIL